MPIIFVPGTPSGPPGLTVQDLLDLDFLRANASDQIIKGDGTVMNGSAIVNTYADLVALDKTVFKEFIILVKEHNYAPYITDGVADFELWQEHTFDAQRTTVAKHVAAESGITWTVANNGSGKVRATTAASANHGLTANAVGAQFTVKTTQNGWVAEQKFTILAVTTSAPFSVDLDVAIGSLGVPVFYLKGEIVKLKEFTIPKLRPFSRYFIESGFRCDVDASSTKHLFFYLENTALQDFTLSANQFQPWNCGFYNAGAVNVNRPLYNTNSNGTAASTGAFIADQANDTSTGTVKCSLRVQPTNANVVCELPRYRVRVED